ncbi:hypothetical protein K469DRAFT_453168, partial [Zopfia rhizophila CBS 207.26]
KREDFTQFTNIPADVYGCQLEVNFPAGYLITSSGNNQVNIYHESGDDKGKLFGMITFASSSLFPTKFVVNNDKCSTLMSYKMSIASTTQAGRVSFADTKVAGLTMTYNC